MDLCSADIIYFEPVSRRVFTFNHGSNDTTAIDPAEMKAVGTLAAGRRPRAGRLRQKGAYFRQHGGHQRDRRVRRPDAEDPQSILARSRRRAHRPGLRPQATHSFSAPAPTGSWSSPTPTAARSSQTLEIGPGPDGCIFDAETGLIFSSNGGDGTLAIVREQTPGRYEVARTIKTQVSAKTIALDPKTHRIYLSAATPEAAAPPRATPKKKGGRRYVVPGSFFVLVVGE